MEKRSVLQKVVLISVAAMAVEIRTTFCKTERFSIYTS